MHNDNTRLLILAVASAGGHWIQLRRLMPAMEGHDIVYVTTSNALENEVQGSQFIVVRDATRWTKLSLIRLAFHMMWIVFKLRPDVIISTGAAPGLFAVVFGKLLGARTAWIDSIANADSLSMSGRLAGFFSNIWLTQWQHLAKEKGPTYSGNVL